MTCNDLSMRLAGLQPCLARTPVYSPGGCDESWSMGEPSTTGAPRKSNSTVSPVRDCDRSTSDFLRVRSRETSALPLLVTHGWPGSVVVFPTTLGQPIPSNMGTAVRCVRHGHLGTPRVRVFRPVSELGWCKTEIVAPWVELMVTLGYERYGVQGALWIRSQSGRGAGRTERGDRRPPERRSEADAVNAHCTTRVGNVESWRSGAASHDGRSVQRRPR